MFSRVPRLRRPAVWTGLSLLLTLEGCRGATQVTLELTTSAHCDDIRDVGIAVGPLSGLLDRAPTTTTSNCEDGIIGTLVVVPGGAKSQDFAVRVVGGINQSSAACMNGTARSGCIDARRALSFFPRETIELPIELELDCLDVPCGATETCRDGRCVDATLEDPLSCTDPAGCDGTLSPDTPGSGGTSSAPPFPSTSSGGQPHSTGGAAIMGTGGLGESTSGASGGGEAEIPMGGANGIGGGDYSGPHWELAWHDNFNTFESDRWNLSAGGSRDALTSHAPENAVIANGTLRLWVTSNPDGSPSYLGSELRTNELFTHGRFVARLRSISVSGTISSLSTFFDGEMGGSDFSSLQVESRGDDSTRLDLRRLTRDEMGGNQTEQMSPGLGPPGTDEFHIYMLEWSPTEVNFYIDDSLIFTPDTHNAYFTNPQEIVLSAWMSSLDFLAGAPDPDRLPAYTEVDWIEVYSYVP